MAAIGIATFNRANPLGSFFPFDPFLLRMSHRFIADVYQAWVSPELTMTMPGRRRESDAEVARGVGGAEDDDDDETGMSIPNADSAGSYSSSMGTRVSSAMSMDSNASMSDAFGFGNNGMSGSDTRQNDKRRLRRRRGR